MSTFRRAIALAALAVALVFPTGAFAVSDVSTVTESATAAVSAAMTAPASVTYVLTGQTGAASIALTGINTTFAGTATLTVNGQSGGTRTFENNLRTLTQTVGGGLTGAVTNVTSGGMSGTNPFTLWSKSGAAANITAGTDTIASTVQVSSAGAWSGALTFTLIAN